MNGKSDQGGWLATHFSRVCVPPRRNASSVTNAIAAPSPSLASKSPMQSQTSLSIPFSVRCCAAARASRPIGASTRTRCSTCSAFAVIAVFRHERLRTANVRWRSSKNTTEFCERRADLQTFRRKLKLTNCIFMRAAAFFDDRDRSTNPPLCLEVAQHDDGVAQITKIDWRLHVSEQPMLCQDHDGQYAQLVQI